MPTDEAQSPGTITVRYQLTPALSWFSLWFTVRAWLPFLIGGALFALLGATWRPLGRAGLEASILVSILIVALVASWLHQARRSAKESRGREIVIAFHPGGLRTDTGLSRSEMPWTTLRQIVRGRSIWILSVKPRGWYLIPADALAPDARIAIAGWASAVGVPVV